MRHLTCLSFLTALSIFAAAHEPTVVEKGAHHRTLQTTNELGEVTSEYVQLGTGLNYWSDEEGKWLDSDTEIELSEEGAVFRKGPFKAIFKANLNDVDGTFDLLLPGNKRVVIQCIGLAYTEADTGRSVFIAELKDTQGELVARNTVLYPNCFEGVNADIRASVRVGAFESDVILREQLPSPDTFGLNPATTRLEVWHQVLQNPEIQKSITKIKRSDGILDEDHSVNFGEMFIGPGVAFTLGEAGVPVGMKESLQVAKEWVGIEGMTFLVESLPVAEAAADLNALPKPAQARKVDRNAIEQQFAGVKTATRSRPISIAGVKEPKKNRTFASINRGVERSQSGYVIDYVLLTGAANFTLKGGTTYHVTNQVNLTSTTTIEGGTVVKFSNYIATNQPYIQVHGPVVCNTQPYHPAVFTSEDDDSVGEIISGSLGTPLTGSYYGYYNLLFTSVTTNNIHLHDIRTGYAHNGIGINRAGVHRLENIQTVGCSKGIEGNNTEIRAYNLLSYNNYYAFATGSGTTIHAEHVTAHKVNKVFHPNANTNSFLYLTNSLLVQITNSSVQVFSNYVQAASSGTGVFQEVLAGGHYLTENSSYRNAGTTNITTHASALVQTNTTYPPIIITADFTADTTLAPQAQRDTDIPDLGYHYYPLDYVIGDVILTNTLTFNPGVCVGFYDEYGVRLYDNGIATGVGSPSSPIRLASYNCVQELLTTLSTNGPRALFGNFGGAPTLADVGNFFRFAKFYAMPRPAFYQTMHIAGGGTTSHRLRLRDCELYTGGLFNAGAIVAEINNCLFENSTIMFEAESGDMYFYCYNNVVLGGAFSIGDSDGVWIFKDNLFVGASVYGSSSGTNNTHNGYTSGTSLLPGSPGGTDKTNLVANFTTGPAGKFYYPATGTSTSLTNLVNTGSRSANLAGLHHFTTQTNQVKEGSTQVDIGYHYVTWDTTNSIPFDTDSDGVPDALEDSDGDGVFDTGETDWTVYNSLNGLTGNPGLEVFTPLQ